MFSKKKPGYTPQLDCYGCIYKEEYITRRCIQCCRLIPASVANGWDYRADFYTRKEDDE